MLSPSHVWHIHLYLGSDNFGETFTNKRACTYDLHVPVHLNNSGKKLTSETNCVKIKIRLGINHFFSTFYIDTNLYMKEINIIIRVSSFFLFLVFGFFVCAWNIKISLYLVSVVWLFDACFIMSNPWLNTSLLH